MLLPKIKLSDLKKNFFYSEFSSEKIKYDGSFIEINKTERHVRVKVDIFSKIPFYYYIKEKKILGNTSFVDLVKEVKQKKISLTVDVVSVAAFLKNNCFLENSTYFKEISRVPPGAELVFSLVDGTVEINQYYKYETTKDSDNNINEIADNYVEILNKNFKNYINENKYAKIGISLTGGYDSRMILSLLDNLNISPLAFHYGHNKSDDFLITKEICEKFNLDLNIIEWKNLSYFKKNFSEILEETDFMLPIHHCHLHESILHQKKSVDTVFYGHFMDMQMQGHFFNKKFESKSSQKSLHNDLKKMWCGNPSAFSVLDIKTFNKIFSKEVLDKYEEKIDEMLNKYSYLNSDKQYEISYLLNHGTRRAIAQCQLGAKKIDYYIPALQRDIFEFVWNINTSIKKNRNLQKFIFKKKFTKALELDFVLDNYKRINLKKDNLINNNLEKFIHILKNPKIKILNPYFDFWGTEYQKFDNYKSWMINIILSNEKILDEIIVDKKILNIFKDDNKDLSFAFVSTLFTVLNFMIFYKELN